MAFSTFSDTLTASYDGSVLFGFAEFGYPLEMGSGHVEPYVGLSFVEAETDDFSENGGIAALRFAEDIENALNATAGLRFATSDSSTFQLRGNVGYQAGLGDLEPQATVNLDSGNAFTIFGAPQSRNAGFVQAEASIQLSENASIGISYDGIFGDASQDHAGVARICLLYTSPSPRDQRGSRMPSSA